MTDTLPNRLRALADHLDWDIGPKTNAETAGMANREHATPADLRYVADRLSLPNPSPAPPAAAPISPGGPVTTTETPLDLDAIEYQRAGLPPSPVVDALIACAMAWAVAGRAAPPGLGASPADAHAGRIRR